ncbi:MAG: cohesin domain-containing protein [Candidatus Bathyarchaeaceae archaeon]
MLYTYLITLFIFGNVFTHVGAQEAEAVVYVDPVSYTAPEVGVTFMIKVSIANVTNLYGYHFILWYNTTLLDGVKVELPPNHFLTPSESNKIFVAKREIDDDFNTTHGLVWVIATLLNPESPKNGSGILATITFNGRTSGGPSPLKLHYPGFVYPVKLSDPEANPIPCTAIDGTVEVIPGAPTPEQPTGSHMAIVYVDPVSYTVPEVGMTFTMNVSISNVTNLYGYEFMLWYNTTLLDGVKVELPPNHFLTPSESNKIFVAKREIDDDFNTTHGLVWVIATLLNPESPKNGSGILATITFNGRTSGGPSPLKLHYPGFVYPVKLSDPEANPIPCTAIDGTVEVIPGAPTPEQPTWVYVTAIIVMILVIAAIVVCRKKFKSSRKIGRKS